MMKTLLALLFIINAITLVAQDNSPVGYYDRADGLSNFSLKTALFNIIDGTASDNNGQPAHMANSYSALWDVYEESDSRVERGNVFVWDMYSICDFEFVVDQDRGSGGSSQCEFFNREHSFPRSWFGDNNLDIYTDPFHVIPTDKRVNSERGNLAYGEVIDGTETFISNNGSKKGTSALEGPTGPVFEPINEFKGDIARGYFYIATRYQNLISGWEKNDTDGDSMLDGSSDQVFEDWALNMLYSWHLNDPVSDKERQRQEAIFQFQGNRNPFIDNPQWVGQIWNSVLSAEDHNPSKTITMFPNPATGNQLNFNFPSGISATVTIFSVLGKQVLKGKINDSKKSLNISPLASGVYLVIIQQGEVSHTLKLIKR